MTKSATAPPGTETREAVRVRASIPVRYGPGAMDHTAYAENISEGGLFINTNQVFRVGERLLVCMEFPGRPIVRHGEVMWAIRVPEHMRDAMVCGMGISFVDADPQWPMFFRRWRQTLLADVKR